MTAPTILYCPRCQQVVHTERIGDASVCHVCGEQLPQPQPAAGEASELEQYRHACAKLHAENQELRLRLASAERAIEEAHQDLARFQAVGGEAEAWDRYVAALVTIPNGRTCDEAVRYADRLIDERRSRFGGRS